MFSLRNLRVGIVGLGYVGLPLAFEFGKQFLTTGLDVEAGRIRELKAGRDRTREIDRAELKNATRLTLSSDVKYLRHCKVFIVTMPTLIDEYKRPDPKPRVRASKTVGTVLKKVVYESTAYPSCTEELCVPILERASGLKFNRDFYASYSSERINLGDKSHQSSIPHIASALAELRGFDR